MATRNGKFDSKNFNKVVIDDIEGSSSSSSDDEGPELPKELKQVPSTYASSFQRSRKCTCSIPCWKNWLIILGAFIIYYIFLGLFMWAMMEPMLYDTYTCMVVWGCIWVAFVLAILVVIIRRQHILNLEQKRLEEEERRAEEERLKPIQVKIDEENQ
ncbi:unnamed protein product [Blepharisma stoltei]|uniref:Transmembrane protein n=1 Tax=Blepharisma stoltei TaxID=1481888 RepID=A0AAU9JLN3_9CILI|nr:unnamed protein product [Blepharisma stoltei]